MRNLLQRRIRFPHCLDAHLRKVHSPKCIQPSVGGHDVDACRQEVENFFKDEDLVSGEVGWKLQTREMGLEQEERLEVGCFEIDLIELDWYAVVNATQQSVLMAPNRN